MAAGDIKWFAAGLLKLGQAKFNLGSDTLKLGIIKSAANGGVDPTLSLADPCWGAGGTTNLSSSQVATGGTEYTGPKTLASVTWTSVSNVPTLRATDVALSTDASGFTNGRWGIIYDDTATNKDALGFIDFGADKSIASGPLTINFGGAGTDILTLTQS
jgi:hypothetical protein